jgi:uncharacterized protein YbjT (DUF2867 family)
MAASRKVIVFGPTGAVGSAAARTAAELGAKVVLAMRDTSKPVPGVDDGAEGFERVTADLSKPDTVLDAVQTTGAKHAFFYAARGTPDHMRSTVEALKSGGIELAVFLSSFTVRGDDLTAIPPQDLIPYMHAQVEIHLGQVFGPGGFVAARPGSFASNTLQYKAGLAQGRVKIYAPEATVDCIVPEDIGRVCGTVLARGPPTPPAAPMYLYGPQLLSQVDTVKILAKVLGKDATIESADEKEAYKIYVEERGVPPPFAEYMIRQATKSVAGGQGLGVFGYSLTQEELSNVEKYSGKKATTFEEWAEQNKHRFT